MKVHGPVQLLGRGPFFSLEISKRNTSCKQQEHARKKFYRVFHSKFKKVMTKNIKEKEVDVRSFKTKVII